MALRTLKSTAGYPTGVGPPHVTPEETTTGTIPTPGGTFFQGSRPGCLTRDHTMESLREGDGTLRLDAGRDRPHAAGLSPALGTRRRGAGGHQARVLQPYRLVQGPDGALDDRAGGAPRGLEAGHDRGRVHP